ncbi:MAG: DUF4142 domain-containing protein [Actinomycetota bacterium]
MKQSTLNSVLASCGVLLIGASAAAQGNRLRAQADVVRPAAVAGQNGAGATRERQVHMMDERFIVATALGDMMEIDISRLAESRGSTDQVKALARRLRQDHQTNLSVVRTLASSKGVILPTGMMEPSIDAAAANGGADALSGNTDTRNSAGAAGRKLGGQDDRAHSDTEAMNGDLDRLGLRHLTVEHREHRRLLSGLSGTEFDMAWTGGQVKHHGMAVADFELHSQNARDAEVRSYAGRTLPILQEHYEMTRELAGLPPTPAAAPRASGSAANPDSEIATGAQRRTPTSRVAGYRSSGRAAGARATRRGVAR